MNLQEGWDRLDQDLSSGNGPGRLQRRILPGGRRDFFLGLELPDRRRMLILRADHTALVDQSAVPDSRGLTVRTILPDSGLAEVELVLTDPQHQGIFNILIEDLVREEEEPADERTGVGRFLARLIDWQRLLMRYSTGVLSRESQQGLWGELWTLREVAAPAVGFCAATRAWRGPLGADQDLQLPGAALEVKTSTAHSFERLLIASERQLDVAPDIALALIALSLDARPDHGETLSEIVSAIRSAAAEAGCPQPVEERLLLFGYRDSDADSYDNIGYTIRSRHQFRVHEGFPRIVSSDLRTGVSDVTYSIAVTACAIFEITEGELANLLRGDP